MNNLYEKLLDEEFIYNTFIKCRRNVSWKKSVQLFEYNLASNISKLKKLLEGNINDITFQRETFDIQERGKKRHITNILIEERIIQKMIITLIKDVIINSLIYDNYASIKRRGIHFAKKRISIFLNKYYKENNTNEGYALSVDFSKFFDSIDHKILFEKLREKIQDEKLIQLIEKLMYNNEHKGLNLGSELSQLFAIFYLNELDHFIKEKLKIKYYGRYMDDLVLIHSDKEYLKYCLKEIEKICDKLKIKINKKKTCISKLSSFTFIKCRYSLKKNGKIVKYILTSSYKRIKLRIKKYISLYKENRIDNKTLYCLLMAIRNYFIQFNCYYRYIIIKKLYIKAIGG